MQPLSKFRCALILAVLVLCVPVLAQSDPGTYDEATRLYRNRAYAFSCKVPAGWVLRTEQMKPESDLSKNAASNQVLLAAFERPPEAAGPAPASTILIAAESQSSYPGLKTAEDYFAPLTEVVTAKGFKTVNDPYPFHLGPVTLIRADFSRDEKDSPTKDRPTMYQSTFVILQHGVVLSFTFLAASEDEIDHLIENLAFSTSPAKTTPKTGPKSTSKPKPNQPSQPNF
jgi:hypothetical protein